MQVEFLIVGQGLAGSTLALELSKRGHGIALLANSIAPAASRIAAGLYNPVTGNKLTRTWRAEQLFDKLETYYENLETLLGEKFLHRTGIYRPFSSTEEQNDWLALSADAGFSTFVEKIGTQPHPQRLLHDPLGGLYLKRAGFVETAKFLDAVKKYFLDQGCFIEELFDENKLIVKKERLHYGSIEAEKIVLCHGISAVEGKFFSWLPFHPLKGEIIEAGTETRISTVFNRGCFILPMENQSVKIGSTYNWRNVNNLPSEEGKQELLEKAKKLFRPPLHIQRHYAGIRPATRDRRPFVGKHPEFSNVLIFNGLGTKGVSLAPYLATELADHMLEGKSLDAQINIERFFSLYFERKSR